MWIVWGFFFLPSSTEHRPEVCIRISISIFLNEAQSILMHQCIVFAPSQSPAPFPHHSLSFYITTNLLQPLAPSRNSLKFPPSSILSHFSQQSVRFNLILERPSRGGGVSGWKGSNGTEWRQLLLLASIELGVCYDCVSMWAATSREIFQFRSAKLTGELRTCQYRALSLHVSNYISVDRVVFSCVSVNRCIVVCS